MTSVRFHANCALQAALFNEFDTDRTRLHANSSVFANIFYESDTLAAPNTTRLYANGTIHAFSFIEQTLDEFQIYLGLTPTSYVAPWADVSGASNDYTDLGSTSFTNSSNPATPTTLGTALARAAATNIIGVKTGVYIANLISPSTTVPQWKTTSSGSSGSPITIVAEYPSTLYPNSSSLWSELRNSASTTEWNGNPTFGTNGQNYINWFGFYVDEAVSFSTGDTGLGALFSTTGSSIKYCRLHSNGNNPEGADSLHCSLRVENCGGGITISHNILDNNNPTYTSWNESAMHISHVGSITIEHNECFNSSGGIFVKRNWNAPGTITIRYNYIHDCSGGGIRCDSNCPIGDLNYDSFIYQNLIHDCDGLGFWIANSSNRASARSYVVNNTVVNCFAGWGTHQDPFDTNAGHKFWNNIVATPTTSAHWWENWTSGQLPSLPSAAFDAQHNVYYSYPVFFDGDNISSQTLSYWTGTVGQDAVSPASITTDPTFVGSGSYKLQGGSPALTQGRDLLDLSGSGTGTTIPAGCYITGDELIGVGDTY